MAINIGKTDKGLRFVSGIIITLAGIAFQSWWGVAGLVLIGTALINWCPIYALLGFNTYLSKKHGKHGN